MLSLATLGGAPHSPSPVCSSCVVPERITLPGISKKKRSGRSSPNGSGRGSPMSIEEEDEFNGEQGFSCQYINLDKRLDRRKLMQAEMKAQGLKGQRFSAKMGDDVKDSLVTWQWHSKLNCLYDKKTLPALHDMSKGERGCSGSHIALWKQCLRRNDPSKPMLILEDDAVLWERSGVKFPELTQRLIDAVEQVRGSCARARACGGAAREAKGRVGARHLRAPAKCLVGTRHLPPSPLPPSPLPPSPLLPSPSAMLTASASARCRALRSAGTLRTRRSSCTWDARSCSGATRAVSSSRARP
jgi:hypothetical protein